VLIKFALGVSVAQAAGARELLEALRCRSEVGWRPNEQGVNVDRVDDDLLVLELVGKRLEDLARVDKDNVEDDGEEGVALDAATLAGDVLERAFGEAEVLRDLLLVVSDVLLEQDLVFLLENLDDDCSQELVEGIDAVFRIDDKVGVVLENELIVLKILLFFFFFFFFLEEATPT